MTTTIPKLETIEITLFPSGVAEIAFNRPQRYNALSPQAYRVCHFFHVYLFYWYHQQHKHNQFLTTPLNIKERKKNTIIFIYIIGLAYCHSMGCRM